MSGRLPGRLRAFAAAATTVGADIIFPSLEVCEGYLRLSRKGTKFDRTHRHFGVFR